MVFSDTFHDGGLGLVFPGHELTIPTNRGQDVIEDLIFSDADII
jgi:hypothetical protein